MAKQIDTVQCKLIGISLLNKNEREHVWKEWNAQFHAHEAFWLDVEEGEKTTAALAKSITGLIAQQGIASVAGVTMLVTVFLDLTEAPDEALMEEIVAVPDFLERVLGCNVPIVLEFGYLGQMAFGDKQALRENARQVVRINQINTHLRKQLCLVASSPLVQVENDHSWKAVMTLLDVLRREPAPASIVPVVNVQENTNVGFLRYGAYNEVNREALTEQKERLQKRLGGGGDTELSTVLNTACAKIFRDIEDRYSVDGNFQPIHPNMMVTGFFAKKSAEKGRNRDFERARQSTWAAMEDTAIHLQEMIREAYQEQIRNAEAYLDRFIEESGAGLELESDLGRMRAILKMEGNRARPMAPGLTYKENGNAMEIENYLRETRQYTAACIQKEFVDALRKAYEGREPSYYNQKHNTISTQLKQIDIRLSGMSDKQTLINRAANSQNMPETGFHPVLGGGMMSSFLLCRENEDAQLCDNACQGQVTSVYNMDKKYGGIKTLDDAPIKAIQMLMFDAHNHLEDLIK